MKLTRILLAIAALSTVATAAQTLTFSFGSVQGQGVQAPSGLAPWLTASFVEVSPNSVQLDITSALLESEYLSKLAFNFGDSFAGTDFAFSTVSTTGAFDAPALAIDLNSVNAGVGSTFDVGFSFATSNSGGGTKRFNGNDSISYLITYTGTEAFGVQAFDALDVSGKFKAIAHVQSIGTENTSAWITPAASVPEPAAALLGAFGFLALLRRRRA